jgi:peptidoglycan hydrolase CwlO-like protein
MTKFLYILLVCGFCGCATDTALKEQKKQAQIETLQKQVSMLEEKLETLAREVGEISQELALKNATPTGNDNEVFEDAP